jgi:hypothetical protein
MNYLEEKFQWYSRGIKTIKPSGDISLKQFIDAVISPKPHLLKAFEQIATAAEKGDKRLKDELKTKHLFFITPSVNIQGIRNYESIKNFTQFCVLEYDGIQYSDILRDYIFEKMKSCIFAFSSPSLTGCKFIFRIQVPNSIIEYKELYFGIAHHLDKFKNLDVSNANSVLPLFVSYDPDAKYREDAEIWTQRGYKEGSYVPFEGDVEPLGDINEEDREEVVRTVSTLLNRIEDNGHPQVISGAFLGGGFCASGYISEGEMWELLENLILQNAYLRKNQEGYLKTAQTMFNKGLEAPAYTKRHRND